eukprot:7773079-Ditylum_brightwellii.AAC.1
MQHVTPKQLVTLLHTAVKSLNLHEAGIDPGLIVPRMSRIVQVRGRRVHSVAFYAQFLQDEKN